MSHSLTVRSSLADARMRPLGEKATDATAPEWPLSVPSSLPAAASMSLILPSMRPTARTRPSGENAIEIAGKPGPRVRISRRLSTSQSLTVLSAAPDASVLPSGEKASANTPCEWPICGKTSGFSCAWSCACAAPRQRATAAATVKAALNATAKKRLVIAQIFPQCRRPLQIAVAFGQHSDQPIATTCAIRQPAG
jgi:hypothetical protein